MNKKHSIKDIAKALNVSITSVSFVLNGKAQEKGISKDLAERINSYARSINYKPNALARSFRTGKTNTLALLVEDISNPFFGSIARIIEEHLYEHGYKILYCSTDNLPEKAIDQLNMFKDRYVDGYIISPPPGIEEQLLELAQEKPVVLFDRNYPQLPVNFVGIHNHNASVNATNFLLEKGYKNIGFVTIDSEQSQMRERLSGYMETMQANALNETVLTLPFSIADDGISDSVAAFVSDHKEVEAYYFATNYLGKYGLEAFKNLGLIIPTDIGMVSFDDHDLFRLYNPSITVVEQPLYDIAIKIIELLLENIASPETEPSNKEIILPSKLTVRNSTK